MHAVYKYELPVPRFGKSTIEMPRHAEVLHVAAQGDGIMLWARVDTEEPMVPRNFCVAGTGHRIVLAGRYIGTAHLPGHLVFHVFEAIP